MPLSRFDAIMAAVAVPAFHRVLGIPAIHTRASDDEETDCTAIIESALVPVGEYGERMELRTTATVKAELGAVVGDTISVMNDDPLLEPTVWKLIQATEGGFMPKFTVREVV